MAPDKLLFIVIIDDEADNASINTSGDKKRVIELMKVSESFIKFEKSSYIGYTQHICNIFIDPDTEEEMEKQDLFPQIILKF